MVNLLLRNKILSLSHSFQNYYSSKKKHTPQSILYEGIRICNWEGLSPFMHKSLNLILLLDITTHQKIVSLPWLQTTYWEKVSLIALRQIKPKILLVVHFFSFIITTYLKTLLGTKSLKYKAVSSRIISLSYDPMYPLFYQKCPLLSSCVLPNQVWTVLPLPPNLWERPCRWGRIPPSSKKFCPFPTPEKSPYQIAIFV